MSITVSNCLQICTSPLNTSKSKNLWTFSRGDRFGKLENPNNCAVAFYDLPGVKEKRTAGIGYGNKYDLTKLNQKTPGPERYELPSDFEKNKKKNRGYQFGVSRDKMMQSGILGGTNNKIPGPGGYDIPNTLSKTQYTMRPKTHGDLMILTKGIPGPGTYDMMPTINEKGKYTLSKFTNSGASFFNPPRSKRFPDGMYKNAVPGPGNYKVDNTGIQKTGVYPVSNMSGSMCRSFPKEMRRTGSMGAFEKTPGPGSYRLPSDFGYYESSTKEQFEQHEHLVEEKNKSKSPEQQDKP